MTLREVATGLKFPEGPVAMDDGSVIVVEIEAGRIQLRRRLRPAPPTAADQPYVIESVYKVKDGHSEEYLQLLKKHQFRILDREKTLGDVLSYTVYHPRVGASENRPWDYRIVTVYKNPLVPKQANIIEQQLFPDRDTFSLEENHRLALTEAHWDLPLSEVDPRRGKD